MLDQKLNASKVPINFHQVASFEMIFLEPSLKAASTRSNTDVLLQVDATISDGSRKDHLKACNLVQALRF